MDLWHSIINSFTITNSLTNLLVELIELINISSLINLLIEPTNK
jgi:hypothetical protein